MLLTITSFGLLNFLPLYELQTVVNFGSGLVSGALINAIRLAAGGSTIQSADVMRRAASAMRPRPEDAHEPAGPTLSMREAQVLDLITAGLTNREIGSRLGLAEKTVKNYVSGLLAKLGMERRTQAAVYGAELKHTAHGP